MKEAYRTLGRAIRPTRRATSLADDRGVTINAAGHVADGLLGTERRTESERWWAWSAYRRSSPALSSTSPPSPKRIGPRVPS